MSDPAGAFETPFDALTSVVPRAARFLAVVLESLDPPLSLRQFLVLDRIAAGTRRNVDLARRVQVSGPTISGVVDRLVLMGLVDRAVSADDRRAVTLSLTTRGRRILARHKTRLTAEVESLLRQGGAEPSELEAVLIACLALDRALDVHREHVLASAEVAAETPEPGRRRRQAGRRPA